MDDLTPEAAVGEATKRLTEALADLIVASGRLAGCPSVAVPPVEVDWNPLRLYRVAEVAKLLGTGPQYVYDEMRAGRLRTVKLGNGDRNKERVRATDLAEWIESRSEVPPAVRSRL